MGKRGPKADDPAVAAQKAPIRSRREPKAAKVEAVAQAVALVAAPAWLDGPALDIWTSKAGVLAQAKLLTAADAPAFARYCKNFATWLDLRKAMDAEGYTYEAESYAAGKSEGEGKTTVLRRADPRFLIADRLERQLLAIEDRFGLNPSERQRIMVLRANSGYGGGLFDDAPPARPGDPASPPAGAAKPVDSPLGMLN